MPDEIVRGLGWKPDKLDPRDYKFRLPIGGVTVPTRWKMPHYQVPVYDQDGIQDCVSNAVPRQVQYLLPNVFGPNLPSRLFNYVYSRFLDGDAVLQDTGTTLRSSIKAVNQCGMPLEDLWPHDPAKVNVVPPTSVWQAAQGHKALTYEQIPIGPSDPTLGMLKSALVTGYRVVVGIGVWPSFYESNTNGGWIPVPSDAEVAGQKLLGGHALSVEGYNDNQGGLGFGYLWCANSWGSRVGAFGNVYLPYAYFKNPAYLLNQTYAWAITAMS